MQLLKKLKIDTGKPLLLLNAPPDCVGLFGGVAITEHAGDEKPVSQLVLFATNSDVLNRSLAQLEGHISHQTLIWICYPKKSGSMTSDLVEMKAWDFVFECGYRGQSSALINDDWTGFRITNAPREKASICDLPMEERVQEGINYKNRTTLLPADAAKATGKYAGMADCFYAMSFTFQKEQVNAINGAQKPETRQRRIDKLVEMLRVKMRG